MLPFIQRSIPFTYVFTFLFTAALGQIQDIEPSGTSVAGYVGFSHSRFVDEGLTFNRLPFKNSASSFSLDVAVEGSRTMWYFRSNFSGGKAQSIKGEVDGRLAQGQFVIDNLYQVRPNFILGHVGGLFLGARGTFNLWYVNSSELDNQTLFHDYGLSISAMQRVILPRFTKVDLRVALPLLSYSGRWVADGGLHVRTDETVGSVLFDYGSWKRGRCVQASVDYRSVIGRRVEFIGRYIFQYLRYPGENTLAVYSNSLLVGINVSLNNEE